MIKHTLDASTVQHSRIISPVKTPINQIIRENIVAINHFVCDEERENQKTTRVGCAFCRR